MRLLPLFLLLACGQATDEGFVDPDDNGIETDSGENTGFDVISCDGVTPAVTNLTPAELSTMLESKDFALINVHVPDEGQIPATDTHIAYTDGEALATYVGELGTKVVVYCKTGPMSEIASQDLIDRGYCQVYDLPSGMIGWQDAGYTIE
ncbi:MAG: rhodanese-like domain-containing protein [Deltaproteobacteria bacterium]|nr:MAG: rhodanese-like domain-containing protein [Deltaproteobacteria bacterium]